MHLEIDVATMQSVEERDFCSHAVTVSWDTRRAMRAVQVKVDLALTFSLAAFL